MMTMKIGSLSMKIEQKMYKYTIIYFVPYTFLFSVQNETLYFREEERLLYSSGRIFGVN